MDTYSLERTDTVLTILVPVQVRFCYKRRIARSRKMRASATLKIRTQTRDEGLTKLQVIEGEERDTGFEPATSTLARLHSTTELLPHRKLLFILCPRVLSTGRGHEISNVSNWRNREVKTFVICHCSFVNWQRQLRSRFNARWLFSYFWVMTNEQ